jgi:hypothetical protein
LDAETCLSERECVRVGLELCAALEAAHAVGVVHRDLKPRNVIELASGRLKLLDLGLAWIQEERARLSRTGEFVGSMQYAAPEQFGFGTCPVDGRADLFSLGVSLFQLATGRLPWVEPGIERRHRVPPLGLREIAPGLTRAFDRLVAALLAPHPGARPSTAADVALALEECRRRLGVHEGMRPCPPSQRDLERALRARRQLEAVCVELEAVRAGRGRALLIDAPDPGGDDHWCTLLDQGAVRTAQVHVVRVEGSSRHGGWQSVARQLGATDAPGVAPDSELEIERLRHAAIDAAARLADAAVPIIVLRGSEEGAVGEVFAAVSGGTKSDLCGGLNLDHREGCRTGALEGGPEGRP